MAGQNPNLVYDALAQFDLGIDSGKDAFLLPKNQLSFATNATVRGDFVTNRPSLQIQSLSYATAIQQAVTQSLFQGATYCAPDAGSQMLIAQIGGRLFTFTPDPVLPTMAVQEVSIPGDYNSPVQPQAWLNQVERWVMVDNGVANPIYYDSTTNSSRRAIQGSVVQATSAIASTPSTPPVGGNMVLAMSGTVGNLTNFISQSVQLVEYDDNGNVTETTNWMVVAVGGSGITYSLTLENLGDNSGDSQDSGSQVLIQPSAIGNIITSNGQFTVSLTAYATLTLGMSSPIPAAITVNSFVNVGGDTNWQVVSTAGNIINLRYSKQGVDAFALPTWPGNAIYGMILLQVGNNSPNVVVATLNATLTAPAKGSTTTVNILSAYTSQIGQLVYIGGFQYLVSAYNATPTTPSALNVTFQNLNDTRTSHTFNTPTTTPTAVFNFPEMPPGRMGDYCQGRYWKSLTSGISFIAGDIVGGPSGSPAYNYRDAVLKVSENDLLAGGGSFSVPSNLGQISFIKTTAQLDASLGQGSLMVGTPGGVFSCNAPTDRTTWSTMTTPIVSESLIGLGGLSQNSTIVVNGDLLFRATDGVRSLIMARRDFWSWGNTPISFEMSRVLDKDNPGGLPFGSGVQFDNRMLMTASPVQGSLGVYNQAFVALNFDPISSLQGKANSVWDGMWTGINTLQVINGQFSGVQRSFAFTFNTATSSIEVYEILKTGNLDNGTTPVTWSFETPYTFKEAQGKEFYGLCSLEDGEFYVEDIQPGTSIHFRVQYRPDFSSCWYDWHEFDLCADPKNTTNVYGARLGLGRPPSLTPNTVNATAANFGRWFQYRFIITGHCVWKGMKVSAALQPQTEFARVISNTK